MSGGLFSTVQQAALASGVAIYGGLFTAVAPWPAAHGTALLDCLLVQSATVLVMVLLMLRMRAMSRITPETVRVATPTD